MAGKTHTATVPLDALMLPPRARVESIVYDAKKKVLVVSLQGAGPDQTASVHRRARGGETLQYLLYHDAKP